MSKELALALTLKSKSYYDYFEMVGLVESKYGFKIRSYHDYKFKSEIASSGCSSASGYNNKHWMSWGEFRHPILKEYREAPLPGFGMNKAGMDFYNSADGKRWFTQLRADYHNAEDGECKELPYWDFWHFLSDDCLDELYNGDIIEINWSDIKTMAKFPWHHEIVDCFIAEYGDKEYSVQLEW